MRQVGGSLRVLRFHTPIKLTTITVESGLKHHTPKPYYLSVANEKKNELPHYTNK